MSVNKYTKKDEIEIHKGINIMTSETSILLNAIVRSKRGFQHMRREISNVFARISGHEF